MLKEIFFGALIFVGTIVGIALYVISKGGIKPLYRDEFISIYLPILGYGTAILTIIFVSLVLYKMCKKPDLKLPEQKPVEKEKKKDSNVEFNEEVEHRDNEFRRFNEDG